MALSQQLVNAQKELARRRRLAGVSTQVSTITAVAAPDWLAQLRASFSSEAQPVPKASSLPQETVKAYPSMLTAILKHELAAAGRIYLLARHLDQQGTGWLPVEDMRQALTKKGSDLRVCGWRRLRQIFQQGEGVFWHRDPHGRLWLLRAARIARNLACERFQGKPVALPVRVLLDSIQAVKAHFYASFHSRGLFNKRVIRGDEM